MQEASTSLCCGKLGQTLSKSESEATICARYTLTGAENSELGAGSALVRSQWQEVLRTSNRLTDSAQQRLQVFAALHEIDVGGIDDQQIGRCVVKEEVLIG